MVIKMSATSHSEWPFATASCRGELSGGSPSSVSSHANECSKSLANSESPTSEVGRANIVTLPSLASRDVSRTTSGHESQQELTSGASATTTTPTMPDEMSCSMEGEPVCVDAYGFGVCKSGPVLERSLLWRTFCVDGVVTALGRASESTQIPIQGVAQERCRAGIPCYVHGSLICIGAWEFGICDRGCAVARPLAEGTVCISGTVRSKELNKVEIQLDV